MRGDRRLADKLHRLVGRPHMRRARLDRVMNRDRRQPALPQRARDPAGDLAAVGDQNLAEGIKARPVRPQATIGPLRHAALRPAASSTTSLQPSSGPPASSQIAGTEIQMSIKACPSAFPCGS